MFTSGRLQKNFTDLWIEHCPLRCWTSFQMQYIPRFSSEHVHSCTRVHTDPTVPTFPLSTLPLVQVPVVTAPIFWTQLMNQIIPSPFPLKTLTAFPSHSHCDPGLHLVHCPYWCSVHPLHHCLSHCPKIPFLHNYNPVQESTVAPMCQLHQGWTYSAWLLKQPTVWLHNTCETLDPTSSQSTLTPWFGPPPVVPPW